MRDRDIHPLRGTCPVTIITSDIKTTYTGFAAAFYHLLAFLSSGSMMSVLSGVQTGKKHARQCCGSVSRESPLVPTPS